ncbi:MAG: helix-turn-helix transcriptional regulator [Pyramidobacter sp.]|nr:helix-turn-helix transcriptional regulator [Pyramidobacter sp.]MBQ8129420.1 helix-turn-helix transcriptional regulator [Clostridia bacterium]
MTYGELIREKRRALGLSQAEAAELTGFAKNTFSAWENERDCPTAPAVISTVEKALKMKPGELFMAISYPGQAQVRHRPAQTMTVAAESA